MKWWWYEGKLAKTGLWFDRLDNRSDFNGNNRNLNYDNNARGVLKSSAKPTRAEELSSIHQVKLPHTPKGAKQEYNLVRRVINENLGIKELKPVKKLLERLIGE